MRIGIDVRLWNETGVGRYIRNLVWQLEKIDTTNRYVLFVVKGMTKKDLGITSELFSLVETDIHWHTVEEQLVFYKVIESELLDLVHFPYFSIPILYNRPFVITIHDLIINHFPTGKASTLPYPLYRLKHFGYQYIMKQAAKKAKKILTVSEATKSEIIDHLKVAKDKIVVTYEGVDTTLTTSKEQGTKSKEKYFLYVGNAYPHKNLEYVIDAFSVFVKKNTDIKLMLVGKEDFFYKRLKEKVHALHLEQSILFKNFVSDEELARLYHDALGLIAPSLMEGFGLPPLEAMAQHCLVLASDIPVHKEICRDVALYFNPKKEESLISLLEQVTSDHKNYDQYKDKGKKRVEEFSWRTMVEQTLDLYNATF